MEGLEMDQDEKLGLLDADHPLMSRVQVTLKSHLERQLDEITAQIVEQENYLKTRKNHRQDLGNRVYSIQRDLVECKNKIENLNQELKETVKIREEKEFEFIEAEKNNKSVKKLWQNKKNDEINLQIQIDNHANQLAQLSRTEAEVFTEASVKKTEAERTAKETKYLHVEKFRQDIYVIGLTQEIQRLELNLAGLKSTTESIREETRDLKESLVEAKNYSEGMNEENQKLVNKWKASLNALCKRNEAYSKIQQEHRDAKNEMARLTSEIDVLSSKINKIDDENSDLTRMSNKKQLQIEKLSREMERANNRHEEALIEFEQYGERLEEAEFLIEKLQKKKLREDNHFETLNTRIANAKRNIVKLKLTMASKFSENKNGDLESKRYAEKFTLLQNENKIREDEISAIDVKLFAIKMDISTYESQIATTEEILTNLEDENKKKETDLTMKQKELDQLFVEIDKKQVKVAILQKKVDDLFAVTGGKELGPTELELEKIESEIEEIEKMTTKMQSRWLSAQSQLLALQKNVLERESESEKLRGETEILNARKKRLEDNLNALNGEKELIAKNLKKLQATKDSLNVLLQKKRLAKKQIETKYQSVQDELAEVTKSSRLELEVQRKELEDIENEKDNIELKIVSTRDELLQIEKKIQDFEAARFTLKNGHYSEEIQALTTNIHRKQVYLDQLKRERETLINKMEKGIWLRDGLMRKVDYAAKNVRKNDCKISYENQISLLKRQIGKVTKDYKICESKIAELQLEDNNLRQSIADEESRISIFQKETMLKKEQLETLLQDKYKNTYLLSLKQMKIKFLEEYKNGNYKKRYVNRDLASEMSKTKTFLRDTATVCDKMVKHYPQTSDCVLKIWALRDCLLEI